MVKVAQSILSADFCQLGKDIERVSSADWLHVDVMDGVFVPNISIGIPVVQSLRPTTELPLDVHLMITQPVRYVEQFCDAGADLVTVHVESDTGENILEALRKIRAKGKRAGVVLKPATPAEAAAPFLELADIVLVMTVEPGFGGQAFMDSQLDTIRRVRAIIDRYNPACELEVDLDPYNVEIKALNTIDNASFKDAGQKITYEFEVEEAGTYYLALNYKQSEKADFPVFINVEVDGNIPNSAFYNYGLEYGKSYQTETLADAEGNYLSLNLDAGLHTISFAISADPIRPVLEGIDRIMSGVNNLNLEITKVAGNNKDKYRDLDIEKYIPDAITRLEEYADTLDALCESMKVYNPGVKKIGAFSSAAVASEQLRSLASEPDDLAYRVAELTTSTNSVNQFLANLIDSLNKNDLAIDRIYLYQEGAKLPRNAGFFTSIAASAKRFFTSFASQAYSAGNSDPEHIQVWVNRSRQYLEIMQKMIDEDFTAQTGIQVDLALMPDQNKLILANASGDAPDIATGINYAVPFELGIRGAVKDLTEFRDFAEVADRFEEGLLVPATIGDGIYALPETMNFWVLYVRTDIFDKLGLEAPDTLQDVKNLLPSLQMRGMNFYYPTAGMLAMRNFHGTTPLILQNGGSLYTQFAGAYQRGVRGGLPGADGAVHHL